MTFFPFLAVNFMMKFVAFIFVVSSLLLILLILIQKGKGGGLSGAFGGMGAAGGIFGSKTGDRLTWLTIILVGVFLTLAVVMAKYYTPTVSDFGEDAAVQQTAPSTTDMSTEAIPPEE